MKFPVLMAAVVFAVGLSACSDRAGKDAAITASVMRKLTDQHVPGNIAVATHKGVVTLTGAVPDRQIKERAEGIVKATGGVHDVVDLLHTTMAGDAPLRTEDIPNGASANPPVIPPGGMPPLAPPGGMNIPRPAP